MSNKRYVLYARKSEESDERQVQSLDDQIRLATKKASEQGLTIVEVIHESKSAKEPSARPEFARMLALIDDGKADGILAWHPDRLSRNEMDGAAITYRLRKNTLSDIQFVNYTFVNTPEGIMMLQIIFSQSQYYSSKLGIDVSRGLSSKVDKGWRPGPAPQGYLNELADHTIVPDPERFALIRKAWNLMLTSTYTVPQVLNVLNNEWGYLSRKTSKQGGGPLKRAVIFRMFNEPFYYGEYIYSGVRYTGAHTPMITREEFERVQTILNSWGKQHPVLREFAFTGLIRCGKCGCQVTAEVQKGNTYYHCTNRKGICDKKGLRAEEIERQIEEILLSLELDPDFEALCLEAAKQWFDAERSTIQAGQQQQGRAIQNTQRQLAELLTMRLDKLLSNSEYEAESVKLKAKLKDLSEHEDIAHKRLDKALSSVENALYFAEHAKEDFATDDVRVKRTIATALGTNYVLTDKKVLPELHPLLSCIVKIRSQESGGRTPGSGSGKPHFEHFGSTVSLGGEVGTVDELCQVALLAPYFRSVNEVGNSIGTNRSFCRAHAA